MNTSLIRHGVPGVSDCCRLAVLTDGRFCVCWIPIYDLAQADPNPLTLRLLAAGIQPGTREPGRCADCAYRPGSPERTGSDDVRGGHAWLQAIAAAGDRFWCHEGMRRPVLWRHPSGAEQPGSPANYQPPVINGVPYRADGQPGRLCAGWTAAARRAGSVTA